MLSVEGLESRFAPSSGISAAYIMWCLSACIVEKCCRMGGCLRYSKASTNRMAGTVITK